MRVPCIMRWPRTLQQNEVITEMTALIDFYPTFARLAGATLPDDRTIDGLDIWSVVVTGEKSPHNYFFYGLGAVRSERWKLIDGELYDLINDIGETTNLAGQYPEIVNELQGALDAINEEINLNKRPLANIADFPDDELARNVLSQDGSGCQLVPSPHHATNLLAIFSIVFHITNSLRTDSRTHSLADD